MTKRNSKNVKPSATTSHNSEQRLTMQEILTLGEDAARMLKSDVYCLAHEMTMSQIVDEWLAEENPVEREARWHEAQALGRVARKLKSLVDAAEQVTVQENQRAERDLHRYEDEQGFLS